jgi:hypothetical protein
VGDAGEHPCPGPVDRVALQDGYDEQDNQQQYPDVADERPDRGDRTADQRAKVTVPGRRLGEDKSDVLDEQDSNNSIEYLLPEDK